MPFTGQRQWLTNTDRIRKIISMLSSMYILQFLSLITACLALKKMTTKLTESQETMGRDWGASEPYAASLSDKKFVLLKNFFHIYFGHAFSLPTSPPPTLCSQSLDQIKTKNTRRSNPPQKCKNKTKKCPNKMSTEIP